MGFVRVEHCSSGILGTCVLSSCWVLGCVWYWGTVDDAMERCMMMMDRQWNELSVLYNRESKINTKLSGS